ncbi:MAG: DEAD/DEAH box helicase [Nanoarchaeota archaeon]
MKFNELNIIEPILRALESEGYTEPTPIQEKSIPHLLAGKDLLGIAQTGTGKTAAFAIPILQKLSSERRPSQRGTPRVLILAPTRELAAQIGASFAVYGKNLKITHTVIFGGVSQFHQVRELNRFNDIIIATPGRLLDLMSQGYINLSLIEVFVLDEADRMLDMGFFRDVRKIIARLPQKRQSLFFSATMSAEITNLAHTIVHNPIRIEVTPQATTVEKIEQKLMYVDKDKKGDVLLHLLEQDNLKRVLIFTRTKHNANKLCAKLKEARISADAIHGNKSQSARTEALANFKNGRTRVLVATDIAARGIDIDDISHVINYDMPNEPESYVHRIGRTARAGAEGIAYSLCSADERDFVRAIEKLIRQTIPVMVHSLHSNAAQNATGSSARPPPKQFGRHGGNQKRQGNTRRSFGEGNRDRYAAQSRPRFRHRR